MKLSKVHCAIALVALNCPVFGATIVVNSLPDADNGADGVCSLREAITAANNNANYHECVGSGAYGADIITFSISGTSFADEFLINDTLTIDGAGQSFVVDGGLAHRLFTVNPGKTLTLQNQTIANGAFDCGGSDCGAGILNNGGTLNLINVTINNCNAFTGSGGGIYNAAGGTLNVTGSTLSGNLAKFNGGGIDNAGTAIVTRSMFNNNSAAQGASSFGGGGAIMNTGTLTVTDCTFFNNIAPPGGIGSGGAIMNYGTGTFTSNTFNANSAQGGGAIVNYVGTSTFTSDTFNANSAQRGGAIATPSGTVNIINSTFTANSCHGGGGTGGAIWNLGTTLVTNSTIAGNGVFDNGVGGNIANSAGHTVTLKNTIIANSTAAANCSGVIGNGGNNLSFPDTTCPGINQNPNLGALANNGGPTQTMALQAGSAAINAGDNTNAPARDQRYYLRNGVSDIGAFEFDGALAPINAGSNKTHGASGSFAIDFPLAGTVGIESRSGGANGDHQLLMPFATPVTVSNASITSGTGNVSNFSVAGSQVTVNLTGIANAQQIIVTLTSVNDGVHMNDVNIPMRFLLGDTTANSSVNASDVSQTKAQLGQTVTNSNFRTDVNANGIINASDVAIAKSQVGTSIP